MIDIENLNEEYLIEIATKIKEHFNTINGNKALSSLEKKITDLLSTLLEQIDKLDNDNDVALLSLSDDEFYSGFKLFCRLLHTKGALTLNNKEATASFQLYKIVHGVLEHWDSHPFHILDLQLEHIFIALQKNKSLLKHAGVYELFLDLKGKYLIYRNLMTEYLRNKVTVVPNSTLKRRLANAINEYIKLVDLYAKLEEVQYKRLSHNVNRIISQEIHQYSAQ